MLRLIIAVVIFLVIMRIGLAVLRAMANAPTGPPPAGELRKVNLRYRCSLCGSELKMTMAPDEDPPPPRHCQEDMQPVAPLYE